MGILRKVKKGAAAIAFALMVTLLCSCMDMEIGMTFNKDGGARVVMDMVVEEGALSSMGMTSEEAVDSMMEQMNEDSDMEGWTSEPLTKTIDGDTYSGVRYYTDVRESELLSTNVISEANDSIQMKVERSGGNTKVTVTMNSEGEQSGTDVEQMRSMVNFRFRMAAPGCKIVNTNGTADTDGSVYWDLMDVTCGTVDSIEMTFEYSTGSGLLSTILIIAGAALVIAAVVIVIVRNKNKPAPVDLSARYTLPTETETAANTESPAAPVSEEETPAAPASAEESPAAAKFCTDCGAKAEADEEFCKSCGKKF